MTAPNENLVNCSSEFPQTSVLYKVVFNNPVLLALSVMAIILVILTLFIYIEEICFLFKNCRQSTRRTRFIILLALYPLQKIHTAFTEACQKLKYLSVFSRDIWIFLIHYIFYIVSCTSLLCLLVPTSTLVGDFVSTIYLSVCLYQYVQLTIEYFGGEKRLLAEFGDETITFRTPPCCCCCLCIRPVPLSRKILKVLKTLVLQVAILRPILLFCASVLWTDGQLDIAEQTTDFTSPFTYISFVNSISTLCAVYGLIVTFKTTRTKLKAFSITLKFVSLQLTVILMNLQSQITGFLGMAGLPECSHTIGSVVRASRVHYFLLVLEMFCVSILARFAYRRVEDDYNPSDEANMEELTSIDAETKESPLSKDFPVTENIDDHLNDISMTGTDEPLIH